MSIGKKTKRFGLANVPDPATFVSKFFYNFHTNDEMVNDSGDPRVTGDPDFGATQRLIASNALRLQVPRFVELNWEPGPLSAAGIQPHPDVAWALKGASQSIIGQITAENDVTTDSYLAFSEGDPYCRRRTGNKFKVVSALLGLSTADSNQVQLVQKTTGVDQQIVRQLLAPDRKESLIVNDTFLKLGDDLFDSAAKFVVNSQNQKEFVSHLMMGSDDISQLSSVETKQQLRSRSEHYTATIGDGGDDVNLNVYVVNSKTLPPEAQPGETGVHHVGYILEKFDDTQEFAAANITYKKFIAGTGSTRYIDAKIAYGRRYRYNISNVYEITAVADVRTGGPDGTTVEKKLITFYMSSRPLVTSVETFETKAPSPPEGVFYNFDYSKGSGLVMTWQIPPGRQRDVKGFQVFKRKSIYEPFTCIARYDWNKTINKLPDREIASPDITYSGDGPVTFHIDRLFLRDSGHGIYAVCAVDAHGFTSGYSAQTMVTFDENKNKILLEQISPQGAPKQYPNFFVDPQLDDNITLSTFTQDAILDSGATSVTVYFTPDALNVGTLAGSFTAEGKAEALDQIITTESVGVYKLHMINLDLQKSTSAELRLGDAEAKDVFKPPPGFGLGNSVVLAPS